MKQPNNHPLDWDVIQRRLAEGGRASWRGLEELGEDPAFAEMIHREFPEQAAEWTNPVTRRQFLTLMAASLALAGINGCSSQPAPADNILPHNRDPENRTPGKPKFYATAMTLGGVATGLLVESYEGRPTKIEGNPQHPSSLGATDVFAQASVLGLYDPDRSQSVTYLGRPRAWSEAHTAIRKILNQQRSNGGAGLRVLTGNVTSPTFTEQMNGKVKGTLAMGFPNARWYRHEPARSDSASGGSLTPIYHFEDADIVLSLDADFLSCGPAHLRYVREFMSRRRVAGKSDKPSMNRLYVVETMPSSTGAVADHRLPLRAREIERFTQAVAAKVGVRGVRGVRAVGEWPEKTQRWIAALAADLRKHRGRCIVVTGDGQTAKVHALAQAMNEVLENIGATVKYIAPLEDRPSAQGGELAKLVEEMKEKRVETLLILGCNPVFTAPADLEFEKHLRNVPLRVHLGLYQDETAVQCHWHIPEAHYLEAWGDARAYDGTATIVQPLIAPLYGGRSLHELIAALFGESERPGYEVVRDYWRAHWPKSAGSFERGWDRALHDGFIAGTAFEGHKPPSAARDEWEDGPAEPSPAADELEIVFRPDPALYDGRFANNGWLQELPRPITKLTWDNAAFVSPATAKRLGLTQTFGSRGGEHGEAIVEMVELQYDGRRVEAPVWILPGHADESVTVHFGHGRTRAGRVGNGTGFNAYRLRTSTALWFGSGLRLRKLGRTYTLACTQMHHSMEGRDPVQTGTLDEYEKNRHFLHERESEREQRYQHELVPGVEKKDSQNREADRRLHPLALYQPPSRESPTNRWAMTIDLNVCTGCSACVVACQSENNIPIVGKNEVTRGREMHWLRIDRYYTGGLDNPETHFQPVPCMHCEHAPCELVCPVAATAHSADGLNDMIYNRCVGTRYCSNNCPYKVRRFNFLQYADFITESLKLGRNPDVTVRSRGVMEKCTYCVQRIRAGQIDAEIHGRALKDGEVVTACQAACPAGAITFGDLNDSSSQVTRLKKEPLHYGLLVELNTRPRTTYLAALRNPNPEIE